MSREIKFRAWEIETRQWNNDYKILLNGTIKDFYWDDEGYFEFEVPKEQYVIEQYTGIKDKNGKEIYDGDIVKGRWWRAKNARLDTEGEVRFNEGWFYIKDDPDCQDRLGVPIHNCYNLEVIGNIHENPELLDKSNQV